MDATPFNSLGAKPVGRGMPGAGRAQFGQGSASAMSMKWSALHDAAEAIAAMAGVQVPSPGAEVRNYPAMMRDAGGWRRDLAEQGIEDLAAMLEPGLSALISAHARGVNPAAAALALWNEFKAARDALLGLMPPKGAAGPLRRA